MADMANENNGHLTCYPTAGSETGSAATVKMEASKQRMPAQRDLWAVLLEQEREISILHRQVRAERDVVQHYRERVDPLTATLAHIRQTPILGKLVQWSEALRKHGAWRLYCRGLGKLCCKSKESLALSQRVLKRYWSKLAQRSAPAPAPAEAPGQAASAPAPAAPDTSLLGEILAYRPQRSESKPCVDVIVPVYRGLDETLRCLRSLVAANTETRHEIIVINDQSPDPLLVFCLKQIAAAGLITLIHNRENLGFVGTTNRGLIQHLDRDVVLLNSDTEVFGDWLDRLRRAAYRGKISSVTPFSNNATICSYPEVCQDNNLPPETSAEELDRLCAEQNSGVSVEVPTGVGFCMYVRRDCLTQVGLLNVDLFGKGYGEENDFCMRARAQGWQHVLATDTFVFHRGSVSFGASKNAATKRAEAILNAVHPTYETLVYAHIHTNPALPYRRRLDLARVGGCKPTILFILHGLGGGVERHVSEMASRLEGEGYRSLFLCPEKDNLVRIIVPGRPAGFPNLVFAIPDEYWTLCATLHQLGVVHVHFHHSLDLPARIHDLPAELNVPYDWTVHDYNSVCPRVTMIDDSGSYCGEPGPDGCNNCLLRNLTLRGNVVEIEAWRQEHRRSLAGARRVFVPHEDVARRLSRYFPEVAFTVRRHFESHPNARPLSAPLNVNEPLRVAVIGAIGPHKGVEILFTCAIDALTRSLPLTFHIIGYVDDIKRFQGLPNVFVSGSYREEEVFDLLAAQRCHCAFFPSVCPETYCYTLSLAQAGGLYPVAFDLGAQGERIREWGWGHVLPLSLSAGAINDNLLQLRTLLPHLPAPPLKPFASYQSLIADYYGLTAERAEAA